MRLAAPASVRARGGVVGRGERDEAVEAERGERLAVGRKGHPLHGAGVHRVRRARDRTGSHVDESHPSVGAPPGVAGAIGAEATSQGRAIQLDLPVDGPLVDVAEDHGRAVVRFEVQPQTAKRPAGPVHIRATGSPGPSSIERPVRSSVTPSCSTRLPTASVVRMNQPSPLKAMAP